MYICMYIYTYMHTYTDIHTYAQIRVFCGIPYIIILHIYTYRYKNVHILGDPLTC